MAKSPQILKFNPIDLPDKSTEKADSKVSFNPINLPEKKQNTEFQIIPTVHVGRTDSLVAEEKKVPETLISIGNKPETRTSGKVIVGEDIEDLIDSVFPSEEKAPQTQPKKKEGYSPSLAEREMNILPEQELSERAVILKNKANTLGDLYKELQGQKVDKTNRQAIEDYNANIANYNKTLESVQKDSGEYNTLLKKWFPAYNLPGDVVQHNLKKKFNPPSFEPLDEYTLRKKEEERPSALANALSTVANTGLKVIPGTIEALGLIGDMAYQRMKGGEFAPTSRMSFIPAAEQTASKFTQPVGEKVRGEIDKIFKIDPSRQGFWEAQLPSALGSALGFMAGGFTAKAIKAPTFISTLLLSTSQASEAYREALQKTGDTNTAYNVFIGNLPFAATEVVPFERLFSKIQKLGGKRGTELFMDMLEQGSVEGAQEIIQTWGENLNAKEIYDINRSLSENLFEGGAAGFFVGMFLSGMTNIATKKIQSGELDKKDVEDLTKVINENARHKEKIEKTVLKLLDPKQLSAKEYYLSTDAPGKLPIPTREVKEEKKESDFSFRDIPRILNPPVEGLTQEQDLFAGELAKKTAEEERVNEIRRQKQQKKKDDYIFGELSRQVKSARRKRSLIDEEALSRVVSTISTPEVSSKAQSLLNEAVKENQRLRRNSEFTLENLGRKRFGTRDINSLEPDQQKQILDEYNSMKKQGVNSFAQPNTVTPVISGLEQFTVEEKPVVEKPVAEKPKSERPVKWVRGVNQINEGSSDKFFSASEVVAGNYAITNVGDTPKFEQLPGEQMPKNPLEMGDKHEIAEQIGYEGDPYTDRGFDDLAKKFAQSKGHDAIIYKSGTFDEPELHLFGKEKPKTEEKPKKVASERTPEEITAFFDELGARYEGQNGRGHYMFTSYKTGGTFTLPKNEATADKIKSVLKGDNNKPLLPSKSNGDEIKAAFDNAKKETESKGKEYDRKYIRGILDKYDDPDSKMTIEDVVDEVEEKAVEQQDSEILSQIDKFRREEEYNDELGKRGDMDSARGEIFNYFNSIAGETKAKNERRDAAKSEEKKFNEDVAKAKKLHAEGKITVEQYGGLFLKAGKEGFENEYKKYSEAKAPEDNNKPAAERLIKEGRTDEEILTALNMTGTEENKNKLKEWRNEAGQELQDTETFEAEEAAIDEKISTAETDRQRSEAIEDIDTLINDIDEELKLLGYYDNTGEKPEDVRENGSKLTEQRFKKDLQKFANELKKGLGYEDHLDKKGRKHTVTTNIAPVGGDGTIILWKPNSDYGVYISISVDQEYMEYMPESKNNKVALTIRGGVYDRILWRVTTKKNVYTGLANQWIKKDVAAGEFARIIKKAVDQAEAAGKKKHYPEIGTEQEQREKINELAGDKVNVSSESSEDKFIKDHIIVGTIKLSATEEKKSSSPKVDVSRNLEQDGIEIRFPEKPSDEIIRRMKIAGYRWSNKNGLWWTKYSKQRFDFADQLKSEIEGTEPDIKPEQKKIEKPVDQKRPVTVYEKNYERLRKIFPDLDELKSGDSFRLVAKGFMPLTVEVRGGKNKVLYLSHNYLQYGDVMDDPFMSISISGNMVEALEFQQSNPPVYTEVYPSEGKIDIRAKKDLNSFLSTWLKNLADQGFSSAKKYNADQAPLQDTYDSEYYDKLLNETQQTKTDIEPKTGFMLNEYVVYVGYPGSAKIVKIEGDEVDLKLEGGQTVTVPISKIQKATATVTEIKSPGTAKADKEELKNTLKDKIKSIKNDELDGAINDFLKSMGKITSGIDPEQLAKGMKVVQIYTKLQVYKFADIVTDLYAKIGEDVRDLLDALKQSYASFRETAPDNIFNQMDSSTRGFDLDSIIKKENPQKVLIDRLTEELRTGGIKDNPALTKIADEAYGGTRAQGKYTPQDMYNALEVAVNNLIAEKNLLSLEAEEAFSELRSIMSSIPTQTARTQEKDLLQQFSTPPTIGYVANVLLGADENDIILEPSSGTGNLVAFQKGVVKNIVTNEIDQQRKELLELQGYEAYDLNAEFINSLLPQEIVPTKIIMNPPFSSTGGRVKENDNKFGYRHVNSALMRLAPGGRLVAILGEGAEYGRQNAMKDFWNGIVKKYNVRADIGISGAEYKKYGTTFGNRLIVIDKTEPVSTKPEFQGDFENLEDILENEKIRSIIETTPDVEIPEGGVPLDNGEAAEATEQRGQYNEPAPGTERETRPAIKETGAIGTRGSIQDISQGKRNESSGEQSGRNVRSSKRETGRTGADESAGTAGPLSDLGGPAENAPQLSVEANLDYQSREQEQSGFVEYKVKQKYKGSIDHPTKLVETASMSAIDTPEFKYTPNLPESSITEGKVSSAQLETITYAGQRHEQMLPNGSRAGFFVGDGTGVGKGRIVGGIILDNFNRGRKKAIWVSVSSDLMNDARRDLDGVGAEKIPIKIINDYQLSEPIPNEFNGVIFTTYSSLISTKDNKSRLQQLVDWAGENGLIIFDEAHKAKNALQTALGEPTKTAQAVIDLQEKHLTKARIVYASATGATDPRHMAYMTRLGLWGPGTSFNNFENFMTEIDSGGIGAMEMVARDMKALGMYSARTISYDGVEYDEAEHVLTPEQTKMYGTAAEAWQVALQNIEDALKLTNGSGLARGFAMRAFWAAHQRFFKQFITSLKIPTLLKIVEKNLNEDHSVVISLIQTQESHTVREIGKAIGQGKDLNDVDLSPREILAQMITSSFPVQDYEEYTDENGNIRKRPLVDKKGNPVLNPEAVKMREQLLDKLSDINLPENPLDQIINYFELYAANKKDNTLRVAELTGRKKRLIRRLRRVPGGGFEFSDKVEYAKRVPKDIRSKDINLYEMDQFQKGEKRIALISQAASTGISLHADKGAKNKRRRVQIALELSWSADQQMQTFGRSHRSNQVEAPIFTLLSSNIGGEKRFSSTIARRLASLGALTKGERTATGGNQLAKYDFENKYGEKAVSSVYQQMMQGEVSGIDDPLKTLVDMGVAKQDPVSGRLSISDTVDGDVTTFLNRILALDIDRQNRVFELFTEKFEELIIKAKDSGTYDEGVADLKAESIRIKGKPTVVHSDSTTGAKTEHYVIEYDQKTTKLSFEQAQQIMRIDPARVFYKQKKSGHVVLKLDESSNTDAKTGKQIRKTATVNPRSNRVYYELSDFLDKYELVGPKEAKQIWGEKYNEIPPTETHETHVIAGALLPIWEKLKTQRTTGLKILRLQADNKERIVGVKIPNSEVGLVLSALQIKRELQNPEEIFRAVYEQGSKIVLSGGLSLKRGKLAGDDAIQLEGANYDQFDALREMGLINERINWKQEFYVPTDKKKGMEVLVKLLERFPTVELDNEGKTKTERSREDGFDDDISDSDRLDGNIIDFGAGLGNAFSSFANLIKDEKLRYQAEIELGLRPPVNAKSKTGGYVLSAVDWTGQKLNADKLKGRYRELLTSPAWFVDKVPQLQRVWDAIDKYHVRGMNYDLAVIVEDFWKKGRGWRSLIDKERNEFLTAVKKYEKLQYELQKNGDELEILSFDEFIDNYKLNPKAAKFIREVYAPTIAKALDYIKDLDRYKIINVNTNRNPYLQEYYDTKRVLDSELSNIIASSNRTEEEKLLILDKAKRFGKARMERTLQIGKERFFDVTPNAEAAFETAIHQGAKSELEALNMAWSLNKDIRMVAADELVDEKYKEIDGRMYFPSSRLDKKYYLSGFKENNDPISLMMGETPDRYFTTSDDPLELKRIKEELESKGYKVSTGKFKEAQEEILKNVVTQEDILDLAILAGVETDNEVLTKLIKNIVSKGFNKHFQHKRYVPGFKYDAENFETAIHKYINSATYFKNRHIGNFELDRTIGELKEKKHLSAGSVEDKYIDDLRKRLDARDVETSKALRAVASLYYLAGRISYLAQQIVQPINTLLPYLPVVAKELGLNQSEAEKAFGESIPVTIQYWGYKIFDKIARLGGKRTTKTFGLDKDFIEIMRTLERMGVGKPLRSMELLGEQVDPSKYYNPNLFTGTHLADIGDTELRIGIVPLVKLAGIPGIMVEDFTRTQGIRAFYNLGKKAGLSGDKLLDFISLHVARSFGAASGTLSKPPGYTIPGKNIASQAAQTVVDAYLTFKNFGFMNYGQWGKVWRAYKNNKLLRPLAYKIAAQAGIGGLKYMMWTSSILTSMSLAYQLLDHPEDPEEQYLSIFKQFNRVVPGLGDALYRGFASVTFKVDLSALFAQTAPFISEDMQFQDSAFETIGGAGAGVVQDIITGVPPSAIKNFRQAERYKEQGIKAGRKTLIPKEEITSGDVKAKQLGFTPTKVTEAYQKEKARQFKSTQLGDITREKVSEAVEFINEGRDSRANGIFIDLFEKAKKSGRMTDKQKEEIKTVPQFIRQYVINRITDESEREIIKEWIGPANRRSGRMSSRKTKTDRTSSKR